MIGISAFPHAASGKMLHQVGEQVEGADVAVHESGDGSAPRRRESSVEEESTRRVVD
jgi:hypothetical protein